MITGKGIKACYIRFPLNLDQTYNSIKYNFTQIDQYIMSKYQFKNKNYFYNSIIIIVF